VSRVADEHELRAGGWPRQYRWVNCYRAWFVTAGEWRTGHLSQRARRIQRKYRDRARPLVGYDHKLPVRGNPYALRASAATAARCAHLKSCRTAIGLPHDSLDHATRSPVKA